MGERRGLYRFLVGKPEEATWETEVDGRIILRKWDVGFGLDRGGSGVGQATSTCE
jgi:hypothetical protein